MLKSKQLRILLVIVGISLATLSGYFSVIGLAHLFGNGIEIFLMASLLELSKVLSVSFISNRELFKLIPKIVSKYIIITTFVLMLITSLGVYGYLSTKYQIIDNKINENSLVVDKLNNSINQYNNKIKILDDDNKRVSKQINNISNLQSSSNEQSSKFLTNKNYNRLLKNINSNNDKINKQLIEYNNIITNNSNLISLYQDTLNKYKNEILNNNIKSNSNSDISSLKFISNITGIEFNYIINILIIILVIVFDPLAISLIVASNFVTDNKLTELVEYPKQDDNNDDNKEDDIIVIDGNDIKLDETDINNDDNNEINIDNIQYTENDNVIDTSVSKHNITGDGIYDDVFNINSSPTDENELHGKLGNYTFLNK